MRASSCLFVRPRRPVAASDELAAGALLRTSSACARAPRAVGPRSPSFVRGAELFNAGYYWEAHEVWEGLWHADGPPGSDGGRGQGPDQARRGRRQGARRASARRAHPLPPRRRVVCQTAAQGRRHQLGLDLELWANRASEIAENPPRDPGPPVRRLCRSLHSGSSSTSRKTPGNRDGRRNVTSAADREACASRRRTAPTRRRR